MDTVQCQNCKFDYKSEKGDAKKCPSCSSTFWLLVKTDDLESIPFDSIKPSVEEDVGKNPLTVGSLSRQNMATSILTQKSNPQVLMYVAIGLLTTILLVLVSMGSSGNSNSSEASSPQFSDGSPAYIEGKNMVLDSSSEQLEKFRFQNVFGATGNPVRSKVEIWCDALIQWGWAGTFDKTEWKNGCIDASMSLSLYGTD